MKRLALLTALPLALSILLVPEQSKADASIGERAPLFSASGGYGEVIRLSDFIGRIIVLEWSNHQCPFVGKHYDSGNMQALQREAREQGAYWFTIISSAPGKQGHVSGPQANALTAQRGAHPTAVILDPSGDVGRLYGAKVTPHMYIIEGNGTLAYKGAIDDDPTPLKKGKETVVNYVRKALAEINSGEKVTHPHTRPYGCSIKY